MTRKRDAALTRAEVLGTVAAHADELRRLGVRQLALFGSVARGESQAGSDLDFLVELSPKTFDSYMDAKLLLERLFGVRVDLVLTQTLKPRLRESILREAVKALPTDVRDRAPDVEWQKIAGLRDVLIHAYFGIDLDIVWQVVTDRVPELERRVRDLLGEG